MNLSGNNYFINKMNEKYITEKYINWLNDQEVNKYLEIRFEKQNYNTAYNYIKSFKNNKTKVLWGIFSIDNKEMIGTTNLCNINNIHGTSDISIMVGDKNHWGKPAAEEALKLVIGYAFKNLKLRKIIASTYSINTGINFTLNKIGFSIEGKLIKNRIIEKNKYIDEFKWGLLSKNWIV